MRLGDGLNPMWTAPILSSPLAPTAEHSQADEADLPRWIPAPRLLRAVPLGDLHIPTAGGSNPPVGLGGSGIRGIRRLTGNL